MLLQPQNHGRGMPRPYRKRIFYCPVGRGDPTPPQMVDKQKSAPLAGCRFLLFLDSLIAPDGELGAEGLQHLHQHDQQRRGNKFQHHVKAVVAVVDGNLA